jgi:hypothetical protein
MAQMYQWLRELHTVNLSILLDILHLCISYFEFQPDTRRINFTSSDIDVNDVVPLSALAAAEKLRQLNEQTINPVTDAGLGRSTRLTGGAGMDVKWRKRAAVILTHDDTEVCSPFL